MADEILNVLKLQVSTLHLNLHQFSSITSRKPFQDLEIWHVAPDELDCGGAWAASNKVMSCREKFWRKQLGMRPQNESPVALTQKQHQLNSPHTIQIKCITAGLHDKWLAFNLLHCLNNYCITHVAILYYAALSIVITHLDRAECKLQPKQPAGECSFSVTRPFLCWEKTSPERSSGGEQVEERRVKSCYEPPRLL